MKAVTFVKPGRIELTEQPAPQVGPEDILIDMHYVGLCGTDLSTYRGTMQLVSYPRIPGHENSGIILEKGARVPDTFAEGDQVTISPYAHCGDCPPCRQGRVNCCVTNRTLGVQRDGALLDRFVVDYRDVFTSRELSLKELALVEPMGIGYHATRRGQVTDADQVLVLGCGSIGMGVIAAARSKGARVIATDIDAAKLALAQRFGAEHTINANHEDVGAVVAELTGNEGVDVAIEAAGQPKTLRLAVDVVAHGGRVVTIGYAKEEVSYDTNQFVVKELTIVGSRNALDVFPAVINLIEQRRQPFGDLISHVYPIHATDQAFRDWDARPGEFAKILIDVKG